MSNNVKTDPGERRPGAYYVPTRAAGSYPEWARHPAAGRISSPPTPAVQAPSRAPPDELDRISVIEAECAVIPTPKKDDENELSQNESAPKGAKGNIPISRLTRRECLQNIGFTVVGEGGSTRILPFDAQMMSSRRLAVPMQSSRSMLSHTSQEGWTCVLCSYENADGASSSCSVCGSGRNTQDEPSVAAPSIRQGENRTEPRLEVHGHSSIGSHSSIQSKTSHAMTSIGEETEALEGMSNGRERPTEALDGMSNGRGRPSLRKSLSFKQMMGMSFANWTLSDDGPWTCETCTYLNQEKLHLTCEVCGQARTKDKPDAAENQSLTDYFNASVGSGQALYLEDNEKNIRDLELSVIERERMTELIEEQSRLLNDMKKEENDPGYQPELSPASGDRSTKLTCQSQLDETRRQLQAVREELELVLDNERRELELVEQVQQKRRTEIEREEEVSLHRSAVSDSLMGGSPSHAVLEWMAQQRMLDDWKLQRAAREEQLQDVQKQQAALLEMHEKLCNNERNG